MITELHKDKNEGITNSATQINNKLPSEPPVNDYEPQHNDNNVSLALRRSQHPPKPTNRLMESQEYLSRPHTFAVDTETWIPKMFNEAMKKLELWWEPMVKEFEMLKEREVFELVQRPVDKNVVGSKWVYAIKWDDNGGIEKRKARTVAKGFTQVIGEDYEETYASVARLESVRLLCAIAASRRLCLWQVDFVSAFLNSDSSFEVFMEQPKGFEEGGGDYVWKLQKTLYGTMQGAHDWAENLDKTFEGHGYYKSRADPQIWSKVHDDELTITST